MRALFRNRRTCSANRKTSRRKTGRFFLLRVIVDRDAHRTSITDSERWRRYGCIRSHVETTSLRYLEAGPRLKKSYWLRVGVRRMTRLGRRPTGILATPKRRTSKLGRSDQESHGYLAGGQKNRQAASHTTVSLLLMSPLQTGAIALLILCATLGSVAAPASPIQLSCSVNGISIIDGDEHPISETVEVVVTEREWLDIDLAGPSMNHFLSGRDLKTKSGFVITPSNTSSGDVWELSNKVKNPNNRGANETSVRINRLSGSFWFFKDGRLSSGHTIRTKATGTCAKQSSQRQF